MFLDNTFATYLFGTVDSREPDRTVAVISVLFITIFDAFASVLAQVRVLYAGIDLGTLLTAHTFVALTPGKFIR